MTRATASAPSGGRQPQNRDAGHVATGYAAEIVCESQCRSADLAVASALQQLRIDIITQINAAEKALDGVSKIVMKRHVESCVTEAIVRGEGQNKIDELIEAVFKYGKNKK